MNRNLPAPPWLTRMIYEDGRRPLPVRRAWISTQATGQSHGKIVSKETYDGWRNSGTMPYAFYFEYAHRVVYRGRVRFPVTVLTFDDQPDPARLYDRNGDPLPLPLEGQEQIEMIEGNHFIFRPAGTFHAVYVENDVFEALKRDTSRNGLTFREAGIDGVSFGFLECGKDFDQDGGTTG